jgi:hypothetical protein
VFHLLSSCAHFPRTRLTAIPELPIGIPVSVIGNTTTDRKRRDARCTSPPCGEDAFRIGPLATLLLGHIGRRANM